MEFEFDSKKSQSNKKKHGIDFRIISVRRSRKEEIDIYES